MQNIDNLWIQAKKEHTVKLDCQVENIFNWVRNDFISSWANKTRLARRRLTNCFLERRRFVMNFLVRIVTALLSAITLLPLSFTSVFLFEEDEPFRVRYSYYQVGPFSNQMVRTQSSTLGYLCWVGSFPFCENRETQERWRKFENDIYQINMK